MGFTSKSMRKGGRRHDGLSVPRTASSIRTPKCSVAENMSEVLQSQN